MLTDECIRLDIHQRILPLEHLTQSRHQPASGIVGSSGFDLSLLEESQLLAQKQILCDGLSRISGDDRCPRPLPSLSSAQSNAWFATRLFTMPLVLHRGLKRVAEDRATSMNILVNTALAHWLGGKDLLRLG